MRLLMGIFVSLHGLVHLWYLTLSLGWVAFQPEMGWTGRSWLLSTLVGNQATRFVAAVTYSLVAVAFLVAGAGLIASQAWTRAWLLGASALSILAIVVLWDGNLQMPVEKGLLGLLVSAAILGAVLGYNWPGR